MNRQRTTSAEIEAGSAARRSPKAGRPRGRGERAAPMHRPGSVPIRALCVDDHAQVAEGLRIQFAIDGSVKIVGRLATATKLVEEVDRLRPDTVLLDIEMPGADPFEMADRVRRSHPEVRVIILSAFIRNAFISASFTAGACAYFAKSDDLNDLVRGIHEVVRTGPGSFVLGARARDLCGLGDDGDRGPSESDTAARRRRSAPRSREVKRKHAA